MDDIWNEIYTLRLKVYNLVGAHEDMELNIIKKLKIEFRKQKVAKEASNAKIDDQVAEKLRSSSSLPVQQLSHPQPMPSSTKAEVSAIKDEVKKLKENMEHMQPLVQFNYNNLVDMIFMACYSDSINDYLRSMV